MKSVAILGIAQVVKESGSAFDADFIWETTTIVLLMIKEKNREIFRAVLRYLKVFPAIIHPKKIIFLVIYQDHS